MSDNSETPISELASTIESRPRRVYIADMNNFLGLGGKQMHTAAVRVLFKSEEDRAIVKAYKWVKSQTQDEKLALRDEDLLNDTKTVEALYEAYRRNESGDEEIGYKYPAFPSPKWMKDNLSNDEIATLLHIYNAHRERSSSIDESLDMDRIRSLATAIHNYEDTDLPEALLAGLDRDLCVQAFVLLALEYGDLKNELQSKSERAGSDESVALEAREEAGDGDGDNSGGSSEGSGKGEVNQEVPESNGQSDGERPS